MDDWHSMRAALEWQVDLGATECIGDVPINRYEVPKAAPKSAPVASPVEPAPVHTVDPVADATRAAAAAPTLEALRDALATYPHCDLTKGAKSLVFSDGVPGSHIMIIGEAPGRDEDAQGRPFVGRAGQLLDKMLAAIDLSREKSVYITNVLPWRPPQNRDPKPAEVEMMMPFLRRHVELAAPRLLICMGNHSCNAVLGKRGITKLRGTWDQGLGLPVMPMLHPAYLLRQPSAKKQAWQDLLAVQARLAHDPAIKGA
ncbi:MAG: uracil-DNA glycosylase [Pseudomonadota bacterium]